MNKEIIIHKELKHSVCTLNGIMNESNLEFTKRTMIFDALRNHTDLVDTFQHYPVDDISDVDMTLDVVIMSKKRYDKLIALEVAKIYEYEQHKELRVNE